MVARCLYGTVQKHSSNDIMGLGEIASSGFGGSLWTQKIVWDGNNNDEK